ncbi:MAG: BlaI/MecI/CopY family transcriptional regulator, partial [Clostridiales bacterium]|nr:BlaI/MecI/CopY family transcriptional regulator [Clostridiales bacterium]
MELIWDNAPIHAKDVALLAAERIGWNKNTTYTVLKKLE